MPSFLGAQSPESFLSGWCQCHQASAGLARIERRRGGLVDFSILNSLSFVRGARWPLAQAPPGALREFPNFAAAWTRS